MPSRDWWFRCCLAGILISTSGCKAGRAGGAGTGGAGDAGLAGGGMTGGGMTGGSGGSGGRMIGGSGGTGSGGTGGAGVTGGTGAAGSGGGGGSNQTGAAGAGGAPDGGPGGATTDGGSDREDAGTFYPLELNDVTILAPLPLSSATPVLLGGADLADDGTAFVPRALFDRLVPDGASSQPVIPPSWYDLLQLVAVRFDLCDRHLPGACPSAEDARMRLVFQPLVDGSGARDVGFHAFYAIRNDEIATAVAALRDLARTVAVQSGPLRISPALSAADPTAYAMRLRAFVKRYGGNSRLVRLTMNAQNAKLEQLVWVLRGVEKKADTFVDMPILGTTEISQTVTLTGNPGYDVKPPPVTPQGLMGAISQTMFDSAGAAAKRESLAALATVDNPLSHTAETVACVACHVSTVILNARVSAAAIDPLTLTGRYTSNFELSIAGGKSADTPGTLRAFGYLGKVPMISQRVVNETAQTLTELEARYPPP